MSNRFLAVSIGIIVATLATGESTVLALAQQQASKRVIRQHHELEPAESMPPDLSGAMTVADLVALVRVDPQRRTVDDPVPTTEYTLEVLEVFASKAGISVSRTIPLAVIGGTVDRGEFVLDVEVPGFPLTAGQEYIAFLSWHEGRQQFVPVFGADSFWSVAGGRVSINGSRALSAKYRDHPVPAVLNELRSVAAGIPK